MKTKTFTVHTIESAPENSKSTLLGMKQKFGFLPNIMGTMAENPILLNGFAGISAITATTTNLAGTPVDDRFEAQTWTQSSPA
jgi:hypothetical protein